MEDKKTKTPGLRLFFGILLFWALVSFIAPLFAPYAIDYQENIIKTVVDGKNLYSFSPHTPSPRHPLGTDEYGYDLLSSLLYGSRYTFWTIILASLLRTFGGLFIGGIQAHRQPRKKVGFSLFSGLPVFILLYFIFFGWIFNPEAPPGVVTALQILLFGLFGLPSTVPLFQSRVHLLLEEPFIEAARSSGSNRRWLFFKHLLPHVKEDIFIIFSQELVSILTLIGQLGIFSMFIGGTKLTIRPIIYTSMTYEWGGLMGKYLGKIGTDQWWLITWPLTAYLLLFFSLYFA